MADTPYDDIYRELHPRTFPFSPWERQRELRDLWPSEQKKFCDMVDKITERIGSNG